MLPFSDLDLLRLQSILGMATPTQSVDSDPYKSSPANDRLGQVLSQYPQRPVPSTMDKVRGNIAYFGSSTPTSHWGGVPVGFHINSGDAEKSRDDAMYGNFDRAKEDWADQVKPVEYAANQERLYQGLDARNRDITRKEKADAAKEEIDRGKLEISKQRADTYKYAKTHPNLQFDIDREGYLIHKDPATGNTGYALNELGERIQTGKLPEKERIELLQQGKMEVVGAQGQNQLRNIKERGKQMWSDYTNEDGDIVQINKTTGEVRKPNNVGPIHKPSAAGKSDIDTTTTTTVDESGKKKVVTKEKGITVRMIGPDNQEYDVPKDKVQEAIQQHHMKVK